MIHHLIASAEWATTAVAGQLESAVSGESLECLLHSYDRTLNTAITTFEPVAVLDQLYSTAIGDVSGSQLLEIAARDQFVHGWDIAKAIGVSTDLDPELAEQLLAGSATSLPDSIRGEGPDALYGPARMAPEGAPPADRLAAFLGRHL